MLLPFGNEVETRFRVFEGFAKLLQYEREWNHRKKKSRERERERKEIGEKKNVMTDEWKREPFFFKLFLEFFFQSLHHLSSSLSVSLFLVGCSYTHSSSFCILLNIFFSLHQDTFPECLFISFFFVVKEEFHSFLTRFFPFL